MKQNWLLSGVCVGSMILAILGWTRKVDCGCPKDLNASITNPMKRVAATALGANDGTGRPLGGPAVIGKRAAAPLSAKPAPRVGLPGFAGARGPLSVGLGTTGGVGPGGMGGGAGAGSPLDAGSSGFAPASATGPNAGSGPQSRPGVDIRNPGGSDGALPVSTTTSSTSGGTSSTSTTSSSGSSGSAATSTGGTATGGTTTSSSTSGGSGTKPHGHDGKGGKGGALGTSSGGGHDDFGPHDPNAPHGGKQPGHDDFGPHDANGGKGDHGAGHDGKPGSGQERAAPGKDGKPDNHGGHGHDHGHGWFDGWGWGNGGASSSGATEVPEPGTFGLLGAGVAGLAFARWRRRRPKVAAGTQPETNAPDDPA